MVEVSRKRRAICRPSSPCRRRSSTTDRSSARHHLIELGAAGHRGDAQFVFGQVVVHQLPHRRIVVQREHMRRQRGMGLWSRSGTASGRRPAAKWSRVPDGSCGLQGLAQDCQKCFLDSTAASKRVRPMSRSRCSSSSAISWRVRLRRSHWRTSATRPTRGDSTRVRRSSPARRAAARWVRNCGRRCRRCSCAAPVDSVEAAFQGRRIARPFRARTPDFV